MGWIVAIFRVLRVRVGFLALLAALLAMQATIACDSATSAPHLPDVPLPSISRDGLMDRAAPTPTPDPSPTPSPSGDVASTAPVAATPVPTGESDAILVPQLPISEIPAGLPAYSRSDWKHWVDTDGDCQDTRAEVLILESNVDPAFATDRGCRVTGGLWNGPYTGETFTEASEVDIDHLVPLKNAHLSGGWQWDKERKRDYANSMAVDYHLIAVDKTANRAKGARGPEDWQPPHLSYHCEYAYYWIAVKMEWELTATAAEWEALQEMLDLCPVTVEIVDDASAVTSPLDVARLREELGLARTDGGSAATLVATAIPEPFAGSLVINEIMPDPSAVRDAAGEWFEIHNPDNEQAVDLDGWTIGDGDGDLHRISGTVEAPPGGYIVLARNPDAAVNGDIAAAYGYQGITLTNSEDVIELVDPAGQLVDRVSYGSELVFPGASTSLDPAALDSEANDDAANWCRSSTVLPNGDSGTPGEPNDGC